MHEGTKEFGGLLTEVADNKRDGGWPSGVIGLKGLVKSMDIFVGWLEARDFKKRQLRRRREDTA
jgi:hypothetical protein